MKEADLYGYTYDPKKPPGCQDPWAQRPGAEKGGRRELRTRRTRDMLESAAPSEEDDPSVNEEPLANSMALTLVQELTLPRNTMGGAVHGRKA
jgi:hypothetical protein